MSYEDEIFISYAHIDDEALAEGQKGWVELLDERLRKRLAQLLGEPAKIWRDPKLQGNDEFSEVLVKRVSKVALLVSILSPRYLKSEWCLRELDEFCRNAASQGGLTVDGKSRVFKVVKTFTPRNAHPKQLHGLLGYEFYEYDEVSERAREFRPEIDPNRDARYWEKLEDLAWDIKQQIERLHSYEDSGAVTSVDSSTPAIYLAETTSDLSEQRDKIKRELQQRGHLVLPDKELPLRGPAIQEAVREYLKRSRLSVHLVGEYYGIIPEMESERSIIRLQEEMAVERGDDAEFSRLVWLPPGLQPKDERQQKFVAELQNGFTSHNGSELLQVKLEDLKTIIQTKLAQKPKPEPIPSEAGGAARLYLICDQQDVDAVEPLQNHLFERGFEVTLPLLDGSEAEVLQDHKENLLLCDALLIFQGRASEGWLRMKLRELLKLPGYGRTAPLLAKGVYIGAPESQSKDRFKTLEALVIKSYTEFEAGSLESFLARINKEKGGSR
ncbi:MAG: TIR domain-containing protein [Acidobacteriota bacterium]